MCNFAPVERVDYGVGAPIEGKYKRIFTTYPDASSMELDAKEELCDGRKYKLTFNLRPYESVIFEIPFVESTEEELEKEKTVKEEIENNFRLVKNDVPAASEKPVKKTVKKAAEKKSAPSARSKKKPLIKRLLDM